MAKSPARRLTLGVLGAVPMLALVGVGTYMTNGLILMILLSIFAIILAAIGLVYTISYVIDGHMADDLDDLLRRGGR